MRYAFLSLTAVLLILSLTNPSFAIDCTSESYDVTIIDTYSTLRHVTLHCTVQNR